MAQEIWKDIVGFEGLYQISSYDYTEGVFNPENPANQPDQDDQITCVSDALEENEIETAKELLSEVMREVNFLRDYAKNNENIYLLKRLNKIYNKL